MAFIEWAAPLICPHTVLQMPGIVKYQLYTDYAHAHAQTRGRVYTWTDGHNITYFHFSHSHYTRLILHINPYFEATNLMRCGWFGPKDIQNYINDCI